MRFTFFTTRQTEVEKFDEFFTRLRKMSEDCEFNELRDSLIKDMIIIGLRDKKLQERLLRENDITLEKVLSNCRASEASKLQTKSIHNQNDHPTNHSSLQTSEPEINQINKHKGKEIIKQCKFCAGSHPRGACPAYGKICNNCKSKGHYSKCCSKSSSSRNNSNNQNKFKQSRKLRNKQIHTVASTVPAALSSDSEESDDEFFLGSIEHELSKPEPLSDINAIEVESTAEIDQISDPTASKHLDWLINLETNGTSITFKIDTGARANVLPMSIFKRLNKPASLKQSKYKLTAYNKTEISVAGQCILRISHRNGTTPTMFFITKEEASPILSLKTSCDLDLIRRIDTLKPESNLLSEFDDCFGELGTLQEKYHIVTDPNVPPVIDACRNVPIPLRDKLKKELQRMSDLNVITKVTEPTDWVSSLVVVYKPSGALRVCLDPHNLNKAIKRHHHKLPTTEEILSQMSGAKHFTKLDASNAYWQIELDEESSKLLNFNTPFGRYRYLRMPYGIHSASEICQARIGSILANVEGAVNAQDDIIIWGNSLEQLEKRTRATLQAIRISGLKLRKDKCQFNKNELTFLGHLISANGTSPDPRKIDAILNMPEPNNVKELQRFLGMITYLGKFIPKLSDETAPLRTLLEKDVIWTFDEPQRKAVQKLKELVTSSPVLQYYNPNVPTRVSSDASKLGLGAVLEQQHNEEWHPIAFASRSLSSAEQNYCPLERETLSIVFACERFTEYIYGLSFDVFNDHKLLKSIFTKPLYRAPARIQRFLLRLQQFDFKLHYKQGSKMFVSDALSRAALSDSTPEIPIVELNAFVDSVIPNLPMSDKRWDQFRTETANDETLQHVKQYIQSGWPSTKEIHPSAKPYFNIRDELNINSNLVLKGQRIIVPRSMQKEILQILHIGHPGIVKVKARARTTVYWPGINSQLDDLSQKCQQCQEHQNRQRPEAPLQHDIPATPWTKVGTDLFHLFQKTFLLVVDYTSKFFEVSELPNAESPTVVAHTKAIFSRYGIPKEIVSDNGPEYAAKAYNDFCNRWDIHHNPSSPEYPKSNGLAERTVQTIKRTLKKARKAGEDLNLALLALRTTPSNIGQPSPSDQMFNRSPRTLLPAISNKAPKQPKASKTVSSSPTRHTKPELHPGDHVRIHDGKSWSRTGIVDKKATQPRSYFIKMSNGRTLRRNRQHILKTRSEHPDDHESDDDVVACS